MAYLPETLKKIVQLGGNLEITDANYLPDTLFQLAQLAKASGVHVTIESSNHLPDTLFKLAQLGGSHVTIRVRNRA